MAMTDPHVLPRPEGGCRTFHPAEIPRNIEQQRVNDERQRTQRRRSGRVCAGRWPVVNSLTRKRAEVQILLRPQLFWLLRGQFWSSDDPVSKPRDTARIPRAARCPTCLTTSAASGVVA